MNITGTEPAMPFIDDADPINPDRWTGLTIRQYYAGLAMQGLLSSINWNESVATDGFIKHTAELSLKFTNALINELNKIV